MDKYNQGKINSFRDYLATALAKRIEELELRRIQDQIKKEIQTSTIERKHTNAADTTNVKVTFYNWLEERDDEKVK